MLPAVLWSSVCCSVTTCDALSCSELATCNISTCTYIRMYIHTLVSCVVFVSICHLVSHCQFILCACYPLLLLVSCSLKTFFIRMLFSKVCIKIFLYEACLVCFSVRLPRTHELLLQHNPSSVTCCYTCGDGFTCYM